MKRLKKLLVYLSVGSLAFGYLMMAFVNLPQRAEAAETNGAEVVQDEMAVPNELGSSTDTASIANPDADQAGIKCKKPDFDKAQVFDGSMVGVEKSFFNTQDEISANWSGFTQDGEGCSIVSYEYRVKRLDKKQKIVEKTLTAETFFTETPVHFKHDLVEGGSYEVEVRAINNKNKHSDWVSSSGQTLDLTSPDAFSLFLIQNKPYGSDISLSWDASIDNLSGIAEYRLFKNGVEIYSSLSDLTYHDTISGDNLTFNYFVRVLDKAGNFTDSNQASATVDDIAPVAPSISYWIGGKNIVIFWPDVSGASTYEIYRNGVLINSGAQTKYTDTNTVRGQTYSYTVYATDEAGNKSSPSNTLSIYIPKPQVSSVTTTGQVQGTTTVIPEKTEQISPSPSPSGEVQGSETPAPEETAGGTKTNWSLIIAIIIAAAIVISGVLYWWYAREDEEDEI